MRYPSLALLALLALAACTAAEANPKPQKQQAANPDHDLCVAVMDHSRQCTDQYIPTLVDARAQADHPAGIRDAVAKNRDGVIAQAKGEWAHDSSDASIEAMCAQPIFKTDDVRAAVSACQATTDCGQFSACIVPIEAQAWQ